MTLERVRRSASPTMLLAHAILPMQLSFATMGEVAGGYDSTAVNPRTGQYQDSPVIAVGADAQVVHEGVRVHQALRNHTEAIYEPIGGRDPLDSDLFEMVRYALSWEPREDMTLHTDAAYAIGAPTLFFSRAGRPDVSFARRGLAYPHQMIADYALRQDMLVHIRDLDLIQAEAAVEGSYPVTPQPPGANTFTPYTSIRYTHEFNDTNNGHLGMRVQYLDLETFRPVWVGQTFVGWGHNFDDSTDMLLEAGISEVEENAGPDNWDTQPFGRARFYKRFDRIRLLVGASYLHTFGIVSATLGTGQIDVVTAGAVWMPGDSGRWAIIGDATFQYGDGYDPNSNRPITATYANAVAGVRFGVTPWCHLFARYEFQWETDSAQQATGAPQFVRHFAIAGVQLAWGTDELALRGLVPMEQIEATARGMGIVQGEPAAAPVRAGDPAIDDLEQRRRSHLPGDPPDDELEREEREHDAQQGDGTSTPLPGSAPAPGDDNAPNDTDTFRNDEGGR